MLNPKYTLVEHTSKTLSRVNVISNMKKYQQEINVVFPLPLVCSLKAGNKLLNANHSFLNKIFCLD